MRKLPISVIILTLNEEDFIARCIGRVAGWADEVLVVDSNSTDRTREIAATLGARVIRQPWLGWVGQRHAGIDIARNDWCLILEADEIIDDELCRSIAAALALNPDPRTGFVVNRIEEFCGKLLPNIKRRSKRDTFVRLMNRRHSRYDEGMLIHEEVRIEGRHVPLAGRLLHWRDFVLDARFEKDNSNATFEAAMLAEQGARPSAGRLLAMPALRFLWVYLRCGLWRLGMHGLVYSLIHANAEVMRQVKLWELTSVRHLKHPPAHLYTDARASGTATFAAVTTAPDKP